MAAALPGVAVFAFMNSASAPPPSEQTYVSVALAFFNASAILSLFVILYRSERETAEKFGSIIRDNVSTVIVALLINLIGTVVEIFGYF